MFPSLLVKASDMNPRIKSACRELVFEISKAYHRLPFSALPYILQPFTSQASNSKVEHTVHWRHISCRLQVLLHVLKEFGLDDIDRKPKTKLGLKLEGVAEFTIPFLSHSHAEVRDAASDVVVQLAILMSEEKIMPILKNATMKTKNGLTTQHFKTIRDRVRLALGKDDKKEEEALVNKLTEEVSDLKKSVNKKHPKPTTAIKMKVREAAKDINPPPVKSKIQDVPKESKIPRNVAVEVTRDKDGSFEIRDVDNHTPSKSTITSSCIFCGDSGSFTDQQMEEHYIHDCRMLSACPL
jgi:hypothetical protein